MQVNEAKYLDDESFEVECEEEDDGSLILHIPDELVKRGMEFTIINALEKLVKEKERNNDK